MAKYSYGIASLMIGDIDLTTGLMINPVEYTQDVYKGTFNITEEEGTTTDHFSESDSTPKVSFTEVGKEVFDVQFMDTAVAKLAALIGGTVEVIGTRNAWKKPSGVVAVEKSIKVVTLDGTDLEYPRVKITARRNFQLRNTGLWLLDVKGTVLSPMLPTGAPLAAVIVTDPA